MELLKNDTKTCYNKLNSNFKRKFLAEIIAEIVDHRWKVFSCDPGKVLTVNFRTDFERQFNDPFSKALVDVFAKSKPDIDGERHTRVRNACYLLSRARRLKSVHAESISFSIMNSLLSKSTKVKSLFCSETTTTNYLTAFKKRPQPVGDPKEFSFLCIDNYQPPFEGSYTLAANKKCKMSVQTVALRFQFDQIDVVRGTYEYRNNKIKGEELANSYVEYVVESEKILAEQVTKLVQIESTQLDITEAGVDENIQHIMDWLYSRFYKTLGC